ncbi:hypothetical protein L596_028651 [Steinernema carpocapsae]|uniref:Serine/threonine-protein phosphatase n=1 Tax=Steinernema carpocapsae TaxID=34508 RepID=A0A4U5LZ06_STECR|nr:hypothetical protein L596_028651 [Steinernema carpocapsae]
MSDVDRWIVKLLRSEILSVPDVISLCNTARDILAHEPNVVHVASPVVVCGDIHGQFADLMKLFASAGDPVTTNYLFLGDYVDRGLNSVACIQLLMCLKVKFRERFILLRGNHECRVITKVYGFYDECQRKYGTSRVWREFVELFDFLPLTALIDNVILCVHGGLSPTIQTLDHIRQINRVGEIPIEGPLCDLMWSDPDERCGWNPSIRKVSKTFGEAITEEFNRNNGLIFLARAHESVKTGYDWRHKGHVVTIFSAPNYCNQSNEAAYMQIQDLIPWFYKFS